MFLAFVGTGLPALRQALGERCAIVAAKLECFKSRRDNITLRVLVKSGTLLVNFSVLPK
jgi:hypothetical protein